ncbi:hypothetical protein LTR10_013235 [Elasticomyces elasticus]|uniref:DnaJ homologue subfamily C member 28 conserved domain-containing protein n=1 Tax=Exophiala sideris TaxID=1016849 RepID=A0ABR0JCW5_9EURO|nr:hypothetical protein LTR10_013235 [Elasticomyces elasticus]KAK5030614.1 hypothetical protein LTS07_005398 [Exophiala sideris]KAK5038668.1 hypothetical protein LTR13_004415 [Exophiala sideris]KAK5060549.1 hypothetical protein LTR69_005866 [Exophiala sideris]KAK5183461.1 hypothetical protein LTR44_004462 [Eurotiomycetes sp. CCFEE 6388]
MSSSSSHLWTCSRCLRAQRLRGSGMNAPRSQLRTVIQYSRPFSATAWSNNEKPPAPSTNIASDVASGSRDEQEQGAMSRRLAEMAEDTMNTGSKSDRKLMKEAGFSDDLKKQLEERIAQTTFAAENQRAISQVTMPSAAGKGTRDTAAASPWTGNESLHDSALRMLDDSHKRLRAPSRPPTLPVKNLRPAPKKIVSSADRLANARDRTSKYALSQQSDMSEKERERYRKELKDRFSPGARPMPTSLQGLTSLANERIEDAIARGQFNNIPRGKGTNVERDYNANSPFLDTTEYFMNKIIQRQEIVPPWIEKQQELVKAVASFRGRLRNDWRRHAARVISSAGGSVETQVRKAKAFALAEEMVNPRVKKVENLSSISPDGTLTSVTVEERIAKGVPLPEPVSGLQAEQPQEVVQINVTEQIAEDAATAQSGNTDKPANTLPPAPADIPAQTAIASPAQSDTPAPVAPVRAAAYPFRDPTWQKTELAYQTLAVQNLNSLTRSYNLMAPKIAQKPYYTLDRELNRCFADVAPSLADEILERSRKPTVKIAVMPHREGGVLERFGQGVGVERYRGHEKRIKDEIDGKEYGFRQLFKDLFSGSTKKRAA